MGTLVEVQLVPGRILEAVKARILANRARFQRQSELNQAAKGMTRPRVQRQRHNASTEFYRRPEPSAVRQDTLQFAGVYWWKTNVNDPQYPSDLLVVPYRVGEQMTQQLGTLPTTTMAMSMKDDLAPHQYALTTIPANPQPATPSVSDLIAAKPEDDPQFSSNTTQNYYVDLGYPEWVAWLATPSEGATIFQSVPRSDFEIALAGQNRSVYSYRVGSGTSYHEASDFLCLPIQGDRMIVCRTQQSWRMTYQYYEETKTNIYAYLEPYDGNYDNMYKLEAIHTPTINKAVSRPSVSTQNVSYCYIVSKDRIRQIPTPDILRERLDAIYPPPENFEAIQVVNPSFPGPIYDLTFPRDAYKSAMAYDYLFPGGVTRNYARHFGMGHYTFNPLYWPNHSIGNVFTPAVYRWLDGNLELGSDPSYAYMRQQWFPKAPNTYIAPIAFDQQLTPSHKRRMGITRSMPSTPATVVPESAFTERRVVKGYSAGLIAWDWGEPAFCTQRALALGFTPEDLIP
jgi:hypothetical protein